MSDSTQQYITARPVTMDELGAWFTNEVVKEPLFQPLDIPSIEKQLDKVLDELGDYRDVDGYFRAKDRAIDEIKVLFGLEKEETE